MTEIVFEPQATAITQIDGRNAMGWVSPDLLLAQKQMIITAMKNYLGEGEDYGSIAGAGKRKILFKPGAEKLSFMFGLAPEISTTHTELASGHREYMSTCALYNRAGERIVSCSGLATTMESKYRYRKDRNYKILGGKDAMPEDYWDNKEPYRKQGLGAKKIDGVWHWVQYESGDKVENPDIADVYNTILKMAEKRAFVAAVLIATAASSMFTQDLEDAPGYSPDQKTELPEPGITQEDLESINQLFTTLETPDETIQLLLNRYKVKSFAELNTSQAKGLLDRLNAELEQKKSQVVETDGEMSENDIPFF